MPLRHRSACVLVQSDVQQRLAHSIGMDAQGSRGALVRQRSHLLHIYKSHGRICFCQYCANGEPTIFSGVITYPDSPHVNHRQIYTLKSPIPGSSYGRGIMEITSRGHVRGRPTEIMSPMWDLLQICRSYRAQDRPSMVMVEAALAKM